MIYICAYRLVSLDAEIGVSMVKWLRIFLPKYSWERYESTTCFESLVTPIYFLFLLQMADTKSYNVTESMKVNKMNQVDVLCLTVLHFGIGR